MQTRVALVGLLAVLALPPAFPADVGLTISTGGGILAGVTQELVYDWSTGSKYLLSELDWHLAPLSLWGANIGFSAANGFAAVVKVQAGVPLQTGIMEDSDWTLYDAAHTKTNYSSHENHTEQALILDARAGWRFPVAGFTLEPFVQLGLMHFKFTARDGSLQYPPGSTPVVVYGTGIAYEQDWYIPAAGVSAVLPLGARASLAAAFAFSPFVFCTDLDNHFLRNFDFYESMSGGLMLEPGLVFTWALTETMRITAEVSYRSISGAIGDSTQVATGVAGTTYTSGTSTWHAGDYSTYTNGGGAAYSALKAVLLLTVKP